MAASPRIVQDSLHGKKSTDMSSFVIPKNYHKKYHHSTKFLSKTGVKKLAFLRYQLEQTLTQDHLRVQSFDRDLCQMLMGIADDIVIHNIFSMDAIYHTSPSGPLGLIKSAASLTMFKYFVDAFNMLNLKDFSTAVYLGSSLMSMFSFKEHTVENHIKQISTTLGAYTKLLALIEKISHEASLVYEVKQLSKDFIEGPESHAIFLSLLDRVKKLPLISAYRPFEAILASQSITNGKFATSRQLLHILRSLNHIARNGSDELKLKLHETAIVIRDRLSLFEQFAFPVRIGALHHYLAIQIDNYSHHAPNPVKKAILLTLQQKLMDVDGDKPISEQVNAFLAIVTEAYQANIQVSNHHGQGMLPGRSGDIIAVVYNHILTIIATACLSDDKETESLVNQLCKPPVLQSHIRSLR